MRPASTCVAMVLSFCMLAQTQCPTEDLNNDSQTEPPPTPSVTPSTPEPSVEPPAPVVEPVPPVEPWQGHGCPILINEVLAHSDNELPDWIELYNSADIPVNVGGWLLSDEKSDLHKFQIPVNTIIEPFAYIVLYQHTDFGNPGNPATLKPFALAESGETLYLYSGPDPVFPECLLEENFGGAEVNLSVGRHPTSEGGYRLTILSAPTVGAPNAYPLVGPLVINEIMYSPAQDADAEYIELLNISNGPVTLFDEQVKESWQFTDDSGIKLKFPSDPPVTLQVNEHILLAGKAATLQEIVPAGVRIFEWGSGKLANQGETLLLLKPGDVDDKGNRHWIEVDRVDYSDGDHDEDFPKGVDPWPVPANGFGFSLNRVFPTRFGNDPNNWRATIPTPGLAND